MVRRLLQTVEAFLSARRQGSGAEDFLVEGPDNRYVTEAPVPLGSALLYETPDGGPYTHTVVLFVDAHDPGDLGDPVGAEIGVRLEGPGGVAEETLTVTRQEDERILIGLEARLDWPTLESDR